MYLCVSLHICRCLCVSVSVSVMYVSMLSMSSASSECVHLSVKLWWHQGDLMPLVARPPDPNTQTQQQQQQQQCAEQCVLEEAILHEECEDWEAYMELFGQLRNACSLLCGVTAELFPEAAATVLYQEVQLYVHVHIYVYISPPSLPPCFLLTCCSGCRLPVQVHSLLVPQFEEVAGLCQQLQLQQQHQQVYGPLQRYVLRLEALVPLTEAVTKAATGAIASAAGTYLSYLSPARHVTLYPIPYTHDVMMSCAVPCWARLFQTNPRLLQTPPLLRVRVTQRCCCWARRPSWCCSGPGRREGRRWTAPSYSTASASCRW